MEKNEINNSHCSRTCKLQRKKNRDWENQRMLVLIGKICVRKWSDSPSIILGKLPYVQLRLRLYPNVCHQSSRLMDCFLSCTISIITFPMPLRPVCVLMLPKTRYLDRVRERRSFPCGWLVAFMGANKNSRKN